MKPPFDNHSLWRAYALRNFIAYIISLKNRYKLSRLIKSIEKFVPQAIILHKTQKYNEL